MTVIIKELVVKTTVTAHNTQIEPIDVRQLKRTILKDCLQELKKFKKATTYER